jgi:hypothetical protein
MHPFRSIGRSVPLAALACACLTLSAMPARPGESGGQFVADLKGTDFAGGAHTKFGSTQYGERHVNYVYARPTGDCAMMSAKFALERLPKRTVSLHVFGCNNDFGGQCRIAISLNGTTLFEGPNAFLSARFGWTKFALPAESLRVGQNELQIANLEEQGVLGQPPWFMVARCVVGPEDLPLDRRSSVEQDSRVDLPDAPQPMPTPLPEGRRPGFELRGTKGWLWLPEQYLAELPTLAEYGGNFLMICYGSMWNLEGYPEWPERNAWWLPLPEKKREAYLELLRACQARGVELCFSMNPNLSSSRILDYNKPEDLDALWQHYQWFQSKGMKWFSICLDDISQGIDAAGQARVVNGIFERLRASDPEARLIFCPTAYWGDGSGSQAQYLETLATELHQEVFLFWTGDAVVTPQITREAADAYRARCKHRLILWDNYPVNDGNPTLHLGPVTGRDSDLGEVCYGYMSNPLNTESQINRIPLLTCLDYAYNPRDYDPARSIGQAVLHIGETPEQRQVLKDLVELFPGMLVYGKGTSYNPVIERFEQMLDTPHSRYLADLYLRHVEDVAGRLATAFPDRFAAARKTLDKTLGRMRQAFEKQYPPAAR